MLNSREKISRKKRKRESTLGTHETLTKDLTFMTREAWGGGRERAEEERRTMLHLWKETSFWAQDLASSITAPGSQAEIRSQGEGKREERPPPSAP